MMDWYATYLPNHYADQNVFREQCPKTEPYPAPAAIQTHLPRPFWAGHESTVACYWKSWELTFQNLKLPTDQNRFVSPYVDTGFNGNLFMWDSAFIVLFGRYARQAVNMQQTLDNFYCKQHPDGFICREIRQTDGSDCFKRFDPPATGPEILPWAEWEYYASFGDRKRLEMVFPPLMAYHQWMRKYRTWPDGTYWATGWACGMDNQPRLSVHRGVIAPDGPVEWWDHDHMSWIDTCFQAVFSARLLARMADELSKPDVAGLLRQEAAALRTTINHLLWDEPSGFYFDRFADGSLSTVKTIGAYWGLLAGDMPSIRLDKMIAHLENVNEFNRPHRVPSLSADHPDYNPRGGYWRGSVWSPTNYMLLRGLTQAGRHPLAHEIGLNHLSHVVRVFEQTGSLWENYSPEEDMPGSTAMGNFAGWTALSATAVLLEYAFGLRADVPNRRLIWDVRLLESHGVSAYPFGLEGQVHLACAERGSPQHKPLITAQSNTPLELEVVWEGGQETIHL